LWENRADFAIHLLQELGVNTCYVLGSGGGARSAVILAGYLAELHDFSVKGVIADSFLSITGQRAMHRALDRREHYYVRRAEQLRREHGDDWRKVVDTDTAYFRRMADRGGHEIPNHMLRGLRCPILLTGSLSDPVTPGIAGDYARLSSVIANCRIYLTTGAEHPFIWKASHEFRRIADVFLDEVTE
jgi:pimeloyl-ACP methyl ester carboxylesterase